MERNQPDIQMPRTPNIIKYAALITQVGTATPTAIVLQNTLGGDVEYSRTDIGEYIVTLPEAYPVIKTAIRIQNAITGLINYAINNGNEGNSDEIYIQTVDSTGAYYDDGLYKTLFELEIYT